MLGGSLHDDFSHGSASRVENMVKSLLQELSGLRNTTVNNPIHVLKERKTQVLALPN